MKSIALSWPAAPNQNAFIDTTCGMFSDLGMSVRPGDPNSRKMTLINADLFVVHWPDSIFSSNSSEMRLWFRMARVLTNLFLLKCCRTRILWFVHNLQPHDLPPHRQRAWTIHANALARLTDGWITLSPSTAILAKERFPALARKPHQYIWHPPYVDSSGQTREQARAKLGLSCTALIFGHVGLLRVYKNIVPLAADFNRLAPENTVLLLAGAARDGIGDQLSTLAMATRRLIYREGSLSPADFDNALKAMNVFIAPYRNFLHSGSLVHALSRGCVVVAPRSPFTADLAATIGEEWVILYDECLDAGTLRRAARAAQLNQGLEPDLTFMKPCENLPRLRTLLCSMGIKVQEENNNDDHADLKISKVSQCTKS